MSKAQYSLTSNIPHKHVFVNYLLRWMTYLPCKCPHSLQYSYQFILLQKEANYTHTALSPILATSAFPSFLHISSSLEHLALIMKLYTVLALLRFRATCCEEVQTTQSIYFRIPYPQPERVVF